MALGGNELQEGEGHYNDKWKPTGFDTKKIFLSPSIKYSGCPVYAKKQRYMITFPYNLYIMHVQFIIMPFIVCNGSESLPIPFSGHTTFWVEYIYIVCFYVICAWHLAFVVREML